MTENDRLTMTSDKGGVAFTFDLDVTCEKSEITKILKVAQRLKEYEELELTPEQIREMDRAYSEQAKELGEYKNAEKQGKLLKLPCKVGDAVYEICEGFIEHCTVETIFLADYKDRDGNPSYMMEIHYDREDCPWVSTDVYFTDIGKTVFLTETEAEETLQKMNEMEGKHE